MIVMLACLRALAQRGVGFQRLKSIFVAALAIRGYMYDKHAFVDDGS